MPVIASYTLFSMLVAFVVVLGWIAIYYKDKYNKMQDELLDLAEKKDFFYKKPSIMRHDERVLFDILTKLYGEKYFIFPQVKLSDILKVKENVKDHDNLYREIDHRSIDIVFFDRPAMAPILAIELNGASHFQFQRKNRDQIVENILTNAGIRFLAIPVAETYDETALQQQLYPLLTTAPKGNSHVDS